SHAGGTADERAETTVSSKRAAGAKTPPTAPERAPETPPDERAADEPAAGDVRVALKLAKTEFGAHEAVGAGVAAAPTGKLARDRPLDVRIRLDGKDFDSGIELHLDAAHAEGERVDFDLRHVPGLTLAPGEHTAVALATDRTSRETRRSAPVKFRIKPDP